MDYAAATPVDEKAARATADIAKKYYANPNALHREGQEARGILEKARAVIVGVLAAHADEIVFTSGTTEANNLALQGIVCAAHARGISRPHLIVSAIEHPAVLATAQNLLGEHVRVDLLPVDEHGIISPRALRKLMTPETVLVSIMYANNEVGAIQPIREIAKEIRHARSVGKSAYPYFHTDAAQAANYLDLNVSRLGVDLMTISSTKTYGPRGTGALFVKRGVNLVPLLSGGSHERGRRPGTEAVALVAGFAEALSGAEKIKAKEVIRMQKLRDTLAKNITKKVSGTSINGNLLCALPNILNISIEGCDSEALVLYLDAAGIAVSGKSACKSSSSEPSHVLVAMGKEGKGTVGSIRFSLGRATKKEDITRVSNELPRIVEMLRASERMSDKIS